MPYDPGFRGIDGLTSSSDGASHSNGSPTQSSIGSSAGSRTRSPSASRGESSLTNSLTNLAGNLNINLKSGMRAKKMTETEIQCLLGTSLFKST